MQASCTPADTPSGESLWAAGSCGPWHRRMVHTLTVWGKPAEVYDSAVPSTADPGELTELDEAEAEHYLQQDFYILREEGVNEDCLNKG